MGPVPPTKATQWPEEDKDDEGKPKGTFTLTKAQAASHWALVFTLRRYIETQWTRCGRP